MATDHVPAYRRAQLKKRRKHYEKKVITATAMMALAAMAMAGCGQSSAPAETTAAATDAPAEDTTASSDETKSAVNEPIFVYCRCFYASFVPLFFRSRITRTTISATNPTPVPTQPLAVIPYCQITEETARRYAQHIRDLGRYVVDVVALSASRRKDGRIRDRGKHGRRRPHLPESKPSRL